MHSQWLQKFDTVEATIAGYEAMHMIQKGQVEGVGKKDVNVQIKFIENLFRIAHIIIQISKDQWRI